MIRCVGFKDFGRLISPEIGFGMESVVFVRTLSDEVLSSGWLQLLGGFC